jgi:diaminopimelate epimerase
MHKSGMEPEYMSGAGNIFTVLDNRLHRKTIDELSILTPSLCIVDNLPRMEGLMSIDIRPDADFHVEFFNPDGSHGAMCGNGGRCAVLFALTHFFPDAPEQGSLEFTMAGKRYSAEYAEHGKIVRLYFDPPQAVRFRQLMHVHQREIEYTYLNTGSDHCMVYFHDLMPDASVMDFRAFDLAAFAPALRYHSHFGKAGANVNLFMINPENDILELRTWERGVEAETGACGTGAIASAFAAVMMGYAEIPVQINPPSAQSLYVGFRMNEEFIDKVWLQGPAEFLPHARSTE